MPLESLLSPKSIAIVGASEKPSIGRAIQVSLDGFGYRGAVYPVHPRNETVLGRKCYPSLEDLPEKPDAVAFCIGYARIEETMDQLARRGAGAAVIYDGGFAERGEEGRALQTRIEAICRESEIALCGPNCMGILNPVDRSSLYLHELRDRTGLAGNVGLISQSGSICIGLLLDTRRFGFSHVISSGNEAVVGTADYLDYLIAEPDTRVIALFSESIAEPERFVAALDRAAAAGKPVIVLKVGRTERTRRAITSHTGGLAGASRVFSEVLRAHRAIEVEDLDEMAEVIAVCQGSKLPKGRRLAVVTASGGQAELILDVASEAGLSLPALSKTSMAEAERVIGSVTGDGNPLDAWGNGDFRANFPHALATLDASGDYDAIVLCSESYEGAAMGRLERGLDYAAILAQAASSSPVPHYLMGMRPGIFQRAVADRLRADGIPVIGGTRQGLGAIDRVARWQGPAAKERACATGRPTDLFRDRSRRTINEFDAKAIFGSLGMPVTDERIAGTVDEARAAASAIGYPVVLKAVSDDLPHRSEYGLVEVGISSAEALEAAWQRLARAVASAPASDDPPRILVQQMVPGGLEVFAGVSRDPEFGHVLAFGLGGVQIEVLGDFALRLLPLSEGDAEAMIDEIRMAPLLRGARARTPYDVAALAACLYRLADFAHAHRDEIAEIDLNPIKVLPEGQGCRIVDALIVPHRKPGSTE